MGMFTYSPGAKDRRPSSKVDRLTLFGSGDKIEFEDVIVLVGPPVLVPDSVSVKPDCQRTVSSIYYIPTSTLVNPDAHFLSTNHPHFLYRRRAGVSCSENDPFNFSMHQINEAIRVIIQEINIDPTPAAAYVDIKEGVGSVDNVVSLRRSIVKPPTGN